MAFDDFDFGGFDELYDPSLFVDGLGGPATTDLSGFGTYDDYAALPTDAEIAAIRDQGLTTDTAGFAAAPSGSAGSAGSAGLLSRLGLGGLSGAQIAGLLAGLGTAGLGAAGIGQSLLGGPKTATSTQTVSRAVPPPSAEESAVNATLAELLRGGVSQLGRDAPSQQALYDRAMQQYGTTADYGQRYGAALDPMVQGIPGLVGRQRGLLDALSATAGEYADPYTAGRVSTAFEDNAAAMQYARENWPNYMANGPAGLPQYLRNEAIQATGGNLDPRQAETPEAFARRVWPNYHQPFSQLPPDMQAEARRLTDFSGTAGTGGGTWGTGDMTSAAFRGMPAQAQAQRSMTGLIPTAMGRVPEFMDRQSTLTDPTLQYRVPSAIMEQLGVNALGTSRGELPTLTQALRDQIGSIYKGRLLDVDRYVDTGLQDALERARARGYHGGTEIFRESAPGTILAPTMAEAVRQRGTLAGQQAEQELALAQTLPQLGASLASQQANIGFSQNKQNRELADIIAALVTQRFQVPQIASNLEAQRVGTTTNKLGGLAQAAGAYTTPLSAAVAGGGNLLNLNRQLADSLGLAGQVGSTQRTNLIQAGTGLYDTLSKNRLSGLGTTQTTADTKPTSLLDAFAPTAQLLGGVGGLFTGLGAR